MLNPMLVFPTRVGMFRSRVSVSSEISGFPHPRGDVPFGRRINSPAHWFSPPAWGCSGRGQMTDRERGVFPTRVGMFLADSISENSGNCFPHPRGDVPQHQRIARLFNKFSPPAWGCSANRGGICLLITVFPTRVGMFRQSFGVDNAIPGFPHPRGDVP